MTSVEFFVDEKGIYGFFISGHSSRDCDDEVGKIVCSAVSSAAYMTANTISEIVGDRIKATVSEAKMQIEVQAPSEATVKLLEGFRLHIEQMADQYSNNIRINGGAKYVKD